MVEHVKRGSRRGKARKDRETVIDYETIDKLYRLLMSQLFSTEHGSSETAQKCCYLFSSILRYLPFVLFPCSSRYQRLDCSP
jgi:hypothetical protein